MRDIAMRKYLSAAEELELVHKAQAGDNDALALLIDNIRPLLYRQAAKIAAGCPFADSEDLVQEAIVCIIRSLPNYDPARSRFSTYFLHAVRAMRSAAGSNGVVPASAVLNSSQRKAEGRMEAMRHA